MGETWALDDRAARESLTLEVTVTVAVDPSKEVAGASTAQDIALVLSSSCWLTSPSATLATNSQRLDDDMVWEFDATHRLSELTAAWGILAAGATSFEENSM
jgi:hypothetical protein